MEKISGLTISEHDNSKRIIIIEIEDEIIKFIIEEFTFESGVRKLKEIFFDIVGGINLDILNSDSNVETPYIITKEVVFKYINKRHEVVHRKVCEESLVGSINGMYATTLGTGGILPIMCRYYPCDKFLSLKMIQLQRLLLQLVKVICLLLDTTEASGLKLVDSLS